MSGKRTAEEILRGVDETLEPVEFGLADFLGIDPRRRMSGLRNIATFGRSITLALQNLRSAVGDGDFDAWYAPFEAEMKQDEMMAYFKEVRNKVLKEGTVGPVSTTTRIGYFNTNDLEKLPRPSGARGFFMGDRLGGHGWEVVLPDGTVEKYYVELPDSIKVSTTLHFQDAPSTHRGKRLADTSIEALAQHYVEYLRGLVRKAHERFGSQGDPPQAS